MEIELKAVGGPVQGDLSFVIDRNPRSHPVDILGGSDLLKLSAENVRFSLGAEARWDPATERARVTPVAKLAVEGG